ncbi:MAG: SCP2 sterol-binding domain-containing protein [Gammaproteobacteria bacterium]
MSLRAEISMAATGALEAALNRLLRQDPETLAALAQLSGRVIGLQLKDSGVRLFFLPHANGMQVMTRYAAEPDVLIIATPAALVRLKLSAQPQPTLFSGDVKMHGDIETAQRFQQILGRLDVDLEELLSQYVGDIVAHRLGNLGRGLSAWFQQASLTLGQNLSEYVQHEGRQVATEIEVDAFCRAVDTLRDDYERLAARVKRLKAHA